MFIIQRVVLTNVSPVVKAARFYIRIFSTKAVAAPAEAVVCAETPEQSRTAKQAAQVNN